MRKSKRFRNYQSNSSYFVTVTYSDSAMHGADDQCLFTNAGFKMKSGKTSILKKQVLFNLTNIYLYIGNAVQILYKVDVRGSKFKVRRAHALQK